MIEILNIPQIKIKKCIKKEGDYLKSLSPLKKFGNWLSYL